MNAKHSSSSDAGSEKHPCITSKVKLAKNQATNPAPNPAENPAPNSDEYLKITPVADFLTAKGDKNSQEIKQQPGQDRSIGPGENDIVSQPETNTAAKTESEATSTRGLRYYQLLAGKLRDGSISEQERWTLDQWYDNFQLLSNTTSAVDLDITVAAGTAAAVHHADQNVDPNAGQGADPNNDLKSRQDATQHQEAADNELVLRLPPAIAISEAAHVRKLKAGIDKRIKRSNRIKKDTENEDFASRHLGYLRGGGQIKINRWPTAAAVLLILLAGL